MMNIKLLLGFVFISFQQLIFSQPFGTYKLENEGNDCFLKLYKTGNYAILIDQQCTEDIIETLVVSYGKYFINGNSLYLKDTVNHFVIKSIFVSNSFIIQNSFRWMIGKKFIYLNKDLDDDIHYTDYKLSSESIKKDRNNYIKHNLILFPLYYGNYVGQDYILKFKEDHTYKLIYNKIMLSEGVWTRKQNEIILTDKALNHNFYLLVKKDGLISKLIPTDYSGVTFSKE